MVLFTFENTSSCMDAEDILLEKLEVFMMSTPQSISAGCGFCIRVKEEDREVAESMLKDIEYSIYKIIDTMPPEYIPYED